MSISAMLRCVNSQPDKDVGRGASDQEIADAERELGVRLPQSYRAFLSNFGWAEIRNDILYGVGTDVPQGLTLTRTAYAERHELEPRIPQHLVPIMNDGAGNNYCLDTSRFHGDECPVVFWDHEHWDGPNQSPEEVSPSFDHWLINRITECWRSDNA
jgi:SMI1-KNR4 cell-wall